MEKLLQENSAGAQVVSAHPLEDDLDAILRLITWIYFREDDGPVVKS